MPTLPTGDSTRVQRLPLDSERLSAPLAREFEIVEDLGRGMAVVFRAREKALRRITIHRVGRASGDHAAVVS